MIMLSAYPSLESEQFGDIQKALDVEKLIKWASEENF